MDTLYLLNNEFEDTELPGHSFYCRDCMLLNGLLSAFPDRAAQLNVVRVAHSRPRQALVDRLGEENQWLPALVFADDVPADVPSIEHHGVRFVNDFKTLLSVLHSRHGFPEVHP
jgi:hypothetical protein